MYMYMLFFILILLIFIFMLLINFILSKKLFKNREKMSSFECGFDSLSMNRLPFSLQFFVIAVIFLIFDIEIALILPLIYFNKFNYYYMVLNFILILVILLLGLYIEWLEGSLKWFKSFKEFN